MLVKPCIHIPVDFVGVGDTLCLKVGAAEDVSQEEAKGDQTEWLANGQARLGPPLRDQLRLRAPLPPSPGLPSPRQALPMGVDRGLELSRWA